jgi:hypothetical protein
MLIALLIIIVIALIIFPLIISKIAENKSKK